MRKGFTDNNLLKRGSSAHFVIQL